MSGRLGNEPLSKRGSERQLQIVRFQVTPTPTLDGKLPFDAKKMLTYMITKGKYFLSICIRKN